MRLSPIYRFVVFIISVLFALGYHKITQKEHKTCFFIINEILQGVNAKNDSFFSVFNENDLTHKRIVTSWTKSEKNKPYFPPNQLLTIFCICDKM